MSPEISSGDGGADRIRTDYTLRARQVLFQLSYGPVILDEVLFNLVDKVIFKELTKNETKRFRFKTYFVRLIDFCQ